MRARTPHAPCRADRQGRGHAPPLAALLLYALAACCAPLQLQQQLLLHGAAAAPITEYTTSFESGQNLDHRVSVYPGQASTVAFNWSSGAAARTGSSGLQLSILTPNSDGGTRWYVSYEASRRARG